MSFDNQPIIVLGDYTFHLSETLPEPKQQVIRQLMDLLTDNTIRLIDNVKLNDNSGLTQTTIQIKDIVDGRGLACPMPLLKTKVALRQVAVGESLYVVATDPNSQADITAFCAQSQKTDTTNPLLLLINKKTVSNSEEAIATKPRDSVDTIYHFIITKTDSN
ncbi:sulfurtransferase TusA family protein [Psychrobacter immobilis]|uniref:sulfurtransferase TusA family protein n=1 Tax=Psychrobacter immobilis TaxID=498 RepID=UPI0019198EB3|nr:sulfurtransferase TusA family protein [Psychrobacter immobilis]